MIGRPLSFTVPFFAQSLAVLSLPRNPRTHAPSEKEEEEEEEEFRHELHPVIATALRSSAHELTTAAVEK